MINFLQLLFFLSVCLPSFAKTDQSSKIKNIKYSKVATVHGMVCAFCSNSLEKKFKKETAVETLHVDLENKKVSVKFKKGQTLSDKKLKKIITSSGFKVFAVNTLSAPGDKIDKE